jgi:hypothetical protein
LVTRSRWMSASLTPGTLSRNNKLRNGRSV